MTRFDWTRGIAADTNCVNGDGRPVVAYVDGKGFCSVCIGRGPELPQFQPPQSQVATAPHERNRMSKQQQADYVAAIVARCLPKATPNQRSLLEAAVRRHISLAESESAFLAALANCSTRDDVLEILRLVDENVEKQKRTPA